MRSHITDYNSFCESDTALGCDVSPSEAYKVLVGEGGGRSRTPPFVGKGGSGWSSRCQTIINMV